MATKLPTVAIIGRANAGKSSLFNRMVRSQQAIVAREAGTTRDNVLGKVSYSRRNTGENGETGEFWLVDTAGLKDAADEFEAGIQPRALAESLAVLDLLRQFPCLLTGLVAFEIEMDGATQWLLTTDLPYARQYLADVGGNEIAVLDPAEVVRSQYGGVALLGTLG